MKLLSVNVSLPKDVTYKGKTVTTGIFKTPVEGRVKVRRLNLDGDGQADLVGHGGEFRAVLIGSARARTKRPPSSSIHSKTMSTGPGSWNETISNSGSSERTSPSRGCWMRTFKLATASTLGPRFSRSHSPAYPATSWL